MWVKPTVGWRWEYYRSYKCKYMHNVHKNTRHQNVGKTGCGMAMEYYGSYRYKYMYVSIYV